MLIEKVIQDWLIELHYNKPIMIKRNYKDHTITITTTQPGYLIGKGGKDIHNLQDKLKDWKVILSEAEEIICAPNATIDTRDWSDIVAARVAARMEDWYD